MYIKKETKMAGIRVWRPKKIIMSTRPNARISQTIFQTRRMDHRSHSIMHTTSAVPLIHSKVESKKDALFSASKINKGDVLLLNSTIINSTSKMDSKQLARALNDHNTILNTRMILLV